MKILKNIIVFLVVSNLSLASDRELLNLHLLNKVLDVVQEKFASSVETYNEKSGEASNYFSTKSNKKIKMEALELASKFKINKLPKLKVVNGVATYKMGDYSLEISPANYLSESFVLNKKKYFLSDYKSLNLLFMGLKKDTLKTTLTSFFIDEAYANSDWIGDRILATVVITSSAVIYFNKPNYDCSDNSTSINLWENFTGEITQALTSGINSALKKCNNKQMPFDDNDQEYIRNLQSKLNHNTDVTQANLISAILGRNSVKAEFTDWRRYWNDQITNCEPENEENGTRDQNSLVELIANVPLFTNKKGIAYQCNQILGLGKEAFEKNTPYWKFRKQFSSSVCEPLGKLKNCIEEENMNIVCTVKDLENSFSRCYTPDVQMQRIRRQTNKTWIIEGPSRKRDVGESVGK